MICPTCGSQNENDVAFCTQCGSPIANDFAPSFDAGSDNPTELFSEASAPFEAAPAQEVAPAYESTPAYDAAPEYYSYDTSSSYGSDGLTTSDPGAGLGKASKILGIIGLVLMCGYAGAPLSITALILGCIGLKKSKEAGFENKSAKTGRTLGIIGVIFIPIVALIGVAIGTVIGLAESGMF